MDKLFLKSYCEVIGVPFAKASKVIDGRYKPYLSALDDLHYHSSSIWQAKINAIQAFIKANGKDQAIEEINKL